jgi:hypothetical protein
MFPTVRASAVGSALTAAAGKSPHRDALLVVTATEAGCTAILTEDLTDGTVLSGVRIINPFAGATLFRRGRGVADLGLIESPRPSSPALPDRRGGWGGSLPCAHSG